MTDKNTIDICDLTETAYLIDSAEYLIQEMQDDFFDKYNRNKDDELSILAEFNRYRAHMNTIAVLFRQVSKSFANLGITAYDN